MKRMIEINDILDECVESACDSVKELLIEYIAENKLDITDDVPCLNNDLDYSGSVHEIIDVAVPIYTNQIEDTWYLYSNELEAAYEQAGVGENVRENNGMAAIYYYIEQKVSDWYEENAKDICEEHAAKVED